MIYCKDCKKFAKLNAVYVNGLDEIKLAGSCKHCEYNERSDYGKNHPFTSIPTSRVDYEDWDELGIDR